MLTLRPRPATSQAPVVVPIFAPKMIPTPPISEMNPALRNEMVITETSELDCRSVVETIPKTIARGVEPVARSKTRSIAPPPNSLKPSSNISIPNRKIATPAAISWASGLNQKARRSVPIATGR